MKRAIFAMIIQRKDNEKEINDRIRVNGDHKSICTTFNSRLSINGT